MCKGLLNEILYFDLGFVSIEGGQTNQGVFSKCGVDRNERSEPLK